MTGSADAEKVLFYDGSTRGRSIAGALASNLSGGQALVFRPNGGQRNADLIAADGRRLGTVKNPSYEPSIFGSRTVVNRNGRLQVIDVAAGNKVVAAGPKSESERNKIWGDWIITDSESSGDGGVFRAYNVRTKATKTVRFPNVTFNRRVIVGDGFAAIQVSLWEPFYAWDFAGSGRLTTVGTGEIATVEGTRIGWIDGSGVGRVTTLPFGGRSAPRMLGPAASTRFAPAAPAANRWRPQFDLTKPTKAGQLRILAGKRVIRSLPVGATRDGSVRNLVWDGKDSKGKLVKVGTYRWELSVAAGDGTGAARSTDGTAAPSGSITVQAAAFAKAPKPLVSGAAKVKSTLSAKAGTWSPAPTTLSYQWSRNGSKIKKATGKKYRLTKSDKGKVITVTVTARRTGYATTSRTSAGTGKVR